MRLTKALTEAIADRVHRRQWRAVSGRGCIVPAFAGLSEPEREAWRQGVRLYAGEMLRLGWRPPGHG